MPDILVRRVPASIVSALKRRANRHGRSLQGEVVTILEPGSIAAPGLLSTPGIRLAPDLPVAELGNTLMEKVRRTELRRGETWTTTRRVRMLSPYRLQN